MAKFRSYGNLLYLSETHLIQPVQAKHKTNSELQYFRQYWSNKTSEKEQLMIQKILIVVSFGYL